MRTSVSAEYGVDFTEDLITLDPEIKARWVADLRSGNFTQTQGKLHDERGYCCLGVLCEQAVEQNVVSAEKQEGLDNRFTFRYKDNDGVTVNASLPNVVIDWAGVKDRAGLGSSYGKLPFLTRDGVRAYLDDCNDSGMPFNQIADLIEYWY